MKQRFGGIERLFGDTAVQYLSQRHVAVVGVGGVGCWAAEMLARSGVGMISLIDADDLCVTNINRQIHALDSTVGQSKVEVMAARIKDINPQAQVICRQQFFMQQTATELLAENYDLVIDAIDSVKHKVLLLAECLRRKITVITAGGAGGKTDLSAITHADLFTTYGDRLLKKIRYELRKNHIGKRKKIGITAVFSPQQMIFPISNRQHSLRLDCDSGYGTSPMVISSFGIVVADLAIKTLLQD